MLATFYCFPFSAYSGSLVSMLFYPARSRPLDTYDDVARRPELGVVFRAGSVQWEFLTNSEDAAVRVLHQRVLDRGLDYSTE